MSQNNIKKIAHKKKKKRLVQTTTTKQDIQQTLIQKQKQNKNF